MRLLILTSALLLHVSPLARATPSPALIFDGGAYSPVGNGQSQTFGWAFRVNAPIVVTDLGLFDVGADGLADPHALGLWRETGRYSGELLASTTVPEGTAAPLQGGFRYVNISPVTLEIDTIYVVGAHFTGLYGWGSLDPDPADRDAFNNVYSAINVEFGSGITFVGGYSSGQQSTGMTFPYANSSGWPTYPIIGPSFRYEDAPIAAVPDGGSTLLAPLALLGLAAAGWSRQRSASTI